LRDKIRRGESLSSQEKETTNLSQEACLSDQDDTASKNKIEASHIIMTDASNVVEKKR